MNKEESPEQRWNRIQGEVQSSILKDHPNPTREGCPGIAALRILAEKAAAFDGLQSHEGWKHVTRCSPCYEEFLNARDALRHAADDARLPSQKK